MFEVFIPKQEHIQMIPLLLEYLLDLTDLFLNFTFNFFFFAFGLQFGIIAELPDSFLDFTFYLASFAFNLISCTAFHGIPPFLFDPTVFAYLRSSISPMYVPIMNSTARIITSIKTTAPAKPPSSRILLPPKYPSITNMAPTINPITPPLLSNAERSSLPGFM